MIAEKLPEHEPCPECNGEGWRMARMDSIWDSQVCRVVWNSCMACNPYGNLPTPTITYEEFLRRKYGK